MHAYIITGGTKEKRSDYIIKFLSKHTVSSHDTITIIPEPTSIGIDAVRSIGVRLSIRPLASPAHAVVIHDSHTMTPEAQNAFLKTLEEPPGDALILLETAEADTLLPTILSRCHLIRLASVNANQPDEALLQCTTTIEQLLASPAGQKIKIIDTITKTREDATLFLDASIIATRAWLLAKHHVLTNSSSSLPHFLSSHRLISLLRSLLTARTQLQGNITPKLILDNVFINS